MSQPSRTRIFRKVSLERLSSPEQLDSLLVVTSPIGWAALACLAFIILSALLWGFFGRVPTKVQGKGLLVRGSGLLEVFTSRAGLLKEYKVKIGQEIKEGDVVATMVYPELDGQIRAWQSQARLIEAEDPSTPGHAERMADTKRNLVVYQQQYDASAKVLAPFSGRVVDLLADPFDSLPAGTHLMYVEPVQQPMEALIYMAPSDGGLLKGGMPVQIFPVTVKQEQYGCMLGEVDRVARFPASLADLRRKFDNEQLVSELSAGRAPILVNVKLRTDATTPSGFAWSSGQGPSYPIAMGTICNASVIIREQAPISLVLGQVLLPMLSRSAGLERP